jgi:uncharacterized phage protein (TIGR02218 family)
MNSVTRMVTCWKIKLRNEQCFNFTDSDEDLSYEHELYSSGSYFTPGFITSKNDLAQDNFNISGVIDGKYFTRESIMSGDCDKSYIEVFLVNIEKLDEARIMLKTGWVGKIDYSGNNFSAEIISISSKTNNVIGSCYSSSCRVEFASHPCGKSIEDYTYAGEITSLGEQNSFFDNNRLEPDDYFSQGKLIFISGKNDGRSYSVLRFQERQITLNFIIDTKLSIRDKYKIIVGCDKSVNCCANKFNNILNFRGEPYIPSKHKLVACN